MICDCVFINNMESESLSNTLDFSDMFKSKSRSSKNESFLTTRMKEDINQDALKESLTEPFFGAKENVCPQEKENMYSQGNCIDTAGFVQNYLKAQCLELGAEDAPQSVYKLLETLISEKNRWQGQASAILDDNQKLRHECAVTTKERNRESDVAEALRRVSEEAVLMVC